MSEISQIIQYEKKIEETVSQAKKTALQEIEKKTTELQAKLQKSSPLSDEENENINKEKNEKMKKLEHFYDQKLQEALDAIQQKSETKLAEAVEKIVSILL